MVKSSSYHTKGMRDIPSVRYQKENIKYEHFTQRAINKEDGEGGRIYYITSILSYLLTQSPCPSS